MCSEFSECGKREGKRSSSLQWRGNEDVRQIKDASAERLPKLFNLRGSQKQGGLQPTTEKGQTCSSLEMKSRLNLEHKGRTPSITRQIVVFFHRRVGRTGNKHRGKCKILFSVARLSSSGTLCCQNGTIVDLLTR